MSKEIIKVLMYANGLGFERTNPKKYIIDDPTNRDEYKYMYNLEPISNYSGSNLLKCRNK